MPAVFEAHPAPTTRRTLRGRVLGWDTAANRGRRLAATACALAFAAAAFARPAALPYEKILEGAGRSVVPVRYQIRPRERPKGGEGPKIRKITAGVVSGKPGQVLINASSFPEADEGPEALEPFDFRIVLSAGREVEAEVVGLSRELNLAFLRTKNAADLAGIPPIVFEESPPLAVGEEVVVVGLLAEPYDFQRAAYTARLNARLARPRVMFSLDQPMPDLCAGGLVTRPDGKPVGFLGLDLLPEAWQSGEPGNVLLLFGSANQSVKRLGYPMVYPASLFSALVEAPPALDRDSAEKRGWLGITMQPLSRDLADYWRIDSPGGVVLGAVLEGSPAHQAGLQPGDVILEVDGESLPVRDQKDLSLLQKRIRLAGVGRSIPLKVWRSGQNSMIEVKLSSAPNSVATAEEYENDDFGLTVRELTYDVIQALNLDRATRGVIVSKTERAGWAEVSGLDRGDIIQKADSTTIDNLASFRAVLDKARSARLKEISLLVLRNYRTRFLRVQTNWK